MTDAFYRDSLGTIRWFGESWGAPVCDPRAHVETPVGWTCEGHPHMHKDCDDERIKEGDQGVTLPYYYRGGATMIAFHLDCWLHEVGVDRLAEGN
jgi:hypothetical protein